MITAPISPEFPTLSVPDAWQPEQETPLPLPGGGWSKQEVNAIGAEPVPNQPGRSDQAGSPSTFTSPVT